MAKKIEEKDTKVKSTSKKNTTQTRKSTTAKKTTSNKSNSKKASTNSKSITENSNKKATVPKKPTTKKNVKKTIKDKELENTIIIETIENEINKIVENKNDIKIDEQIIEKINDVEVAKVEDAKYVNKKRNKKLLAIGVIISLLGIIALIITLIANRIVDKQFISDNSIALMVIASILIECFGAFIIINES